eukprot:SAG22_NODE_10_length_35702_cov_72.266992_20_plen_118_part_00
MIRALLLLVLVCVAICAAPAAAEKTIKILPGANRRFLLKNAEGDDHNRCVGPIEQTLEEHIEKDYKNADHFLMAFDANGDGLAQVEEIKAGMVKAGVPDTCQLAEGVILEGSTDDEL